jgi:uncharacterized protein (TIGR03382 family)
VRVWAVLLGGLIACNAPVDPTLSTTEQLAVVVGPPSTNFGSVAINTSSAPATFTVSPAGSGETDQTITSIIGCDGFEISAPGLPAEVFKHCLTDDIPMETMPQAVVEQVACPSSTISTYSFTATFSPKVTGPLSCLGQIVMNNGTQTFRMDGTGVLPPFVIDVRPRNVNFGDIRVNTPSDIRVVTVANAGANDLDVTTTFTGPSQLKLGKGTLGAHKLDKGTAETFEIQCGPTMPPASYQATLTIDSNDPLNPKITVPIACNGILSALAIDPLAFSTLTLVDKPASATVTLKNEGNVDGLIKSVELGPDTHPDVSFVTRPAANTPLLANQASSQEIEIQYSPAAALAAGELGTIIVEFDNDAPRTISISGEAKLAKVASDPPAVAFGPVCANVATTAEVSVYAAADGSFTVEGGTTTAPFSVVPLQESHQILPLGEGRQNFMVSITPAEPTEDNTEIAGELAIQNDAPLQNNFAIPMTAQPLRAGVTTTEELSLGVAEVGEFTSAQPVKFTNCSETDIMIVEEPRILGANASEFKLSRAFQPTLVARAQTIELDVLFAPKAPGQRVAELEIVYAGGTSTIALVGDGLGGELDGRDTYYACSSGGGEAAWPLGLVVIAIGRRRRRR